ncbi:transposase family protein [Pseudonocardia broussonetiae]|uniref:transposase family protein n=1 Tax=Pseudonocardia broussonetiae TaxID=2736640 RepID=UPI003B833CB1
MPSYPAGIGVSNHALITVSDALRHRRTVLGTRWRRLLAGQQALLVLAHLRKGETYADLAAGFAVGTTTVFRYIREALDVLAAFAPSLQQAMAVAAGKAFVILDGTLVSIDRVGVGTGRDRTYYSGKHKRHGVKVKVLADPAGRLIWASGALPGARHDMGAAHEHGLIHALHAAEVRVIADNGYRGSGFAIPQRRRPRDPETGRRRLSRNQREVVVTKFGPG